MRSVLVIVSLFVMLDLGACDRPSAKSATTRTAEMVFHDWQTIKDQDQRSGIASEIVRGRHLHGFTAKQVIQTLGEPNRRQMSATYGDIKYIIGPSGVDDLWLCIHLTDDHVTASEIRSD